MKSSERKISQCILPLSLLFVLEYTVMLLLITSVKARLTKNIHVWNLLNSPQNVCNSSSNLLNLQCMKRVGTLSLWKCGQLTFFYRCYCDRCSSELTQLAPLAFSQGRSTRYSDRLHDFSVTIPRCYKDVYVNSFFPHATRLMNSLSIECFPLTYDVSCFKSRINRYLLTVGSF